MLTAAAGILLASIQTPTLDLPREFRAVWVATVDNIDWPSKRGIPAAQARRELLAIIDRAADLKLNAVIFQVRPTADALYKSKIEPWSEYLTGAQGKAPDEDWDPLKFAVDECHKRGLELHCWFNPYRARHPAAKSPDAPTHISKTNPSIVKTYGRYLWMDPSEKAVQDRTYNVMMDVAKRYDIDGVHIDDYFYPYKEKGPDGKDLDFPDDASWNRYRASGGKLNRGDWRRKSVDDFIERFYKGLKKEKAWVKFGISPFGIYRPGVPAGIQAGVDQYADLYADAKKWYEKGWCDYFTPQLYWKITQAPQSFPVLLNWWNAPEQNKSGRHLWPGLYTSRVLPEVTNWEPQEIIDQIGLVRDAVKHPGHVHFSMKPLMQNTKGVNGELGKLYGRPALVPASPWLGEAKPRVTQTSVRDRIARWTTTPDAKLVAVKRTSDGEWRITSDRSVPLGNGQKVTVVPISRTGILGTPMTIGG